MLQSKRRRSVGIAGPFLTSSGIAHAQVSAREKHGAAQVVYTTPGVASRDPDDACFSECGVMNMCAPRARR